MKRYAVNYFNGEIAHVLKNRLFGATEREVINMILENYLEVNDTEYFDTLEEAKEAFDRFDPDTYWQASNVGHVLIAKAAELEEQELDEDGDAVEFENIDFKAKAIYDEKMLDELIEKTNRKASKEEEIHTKDELEEMLSEEEFEEVIEARWVFDNDDYVILRDGEYESLNAKEAVEYCMSILRAEDL